MIESEPPARAALPPLSRRALLKGSALGLGLAAAPLAAQGGPRGFTHGVASGEPAPTSVLLWTRHVAEQDSAIRFEVSDSLDFAHVLAGGEVTASPANDGCCKARADGLAPDRWYYFRFTAPDGSHSDIGRTRTLPVGPTARWRMAAFSCSNIGFGWFNAYAHAAEANEFDCALHLGDYFYEYGPGIYPAKALAGRGEFPASEIVALADYRARYAQYRSDADLRRLHQLYPMISGWDDHEITNDAWQDGAENHQPASEGPYAERRAAAVRAYREWMPVSDEPWAAYEIGDLATLYRLETRLTARSEPFNLARIVSAGGGTPEGTQSALRAFRDGSWRDPSREVLGAAQSAWLAAGLKGSRRAGKTWQVLLQQVIMGQRFSSAEVAAALPADTPAYIRQRALAGAMAAAEGVPFAMDSWDGYPNARERLFTAALDADANLVTLTGDSHNAWGFDLDLKGTPVGVEYAGTSVSSPGFETNLPQFSPADLARMGVESSPQLKWMDASQRGYMAIELTPGAAVCEHRFTGVATQRSARLAGSHRLSCAPGTKRLDAG